MTNNIDRAAEIIHQHHDNCTDAAAHLDLAGLLAPDLPEPQTFPNGEKEWCLLDGWVNLDTDGTIAVVHDERDEDDIAAGAEIEPGELVFTKISEARALALSLLAAADHAEEADRAAVAEVIRLRRALEGRLRVWEKVADRLTAQGDHGAELMRLVLKQIARILEGNNHE